MYTITFTFMLLDFISGIIKAFVVKNLNSTTMREGLFHKMGSTLCIILGALCQYSIKYFDIGINVQVAYCVCSYIVLMEILSIIENIGAINPELIPQNIKELFLKLKGGSGNGKDN